MSTAGKRTLDVATVNKVAAWHRREATLLMQAAVRAENESRHRAVRVLSVRATEQERCAEYWESVAFAQSQATRDAPEKKPVTKRKRRKATK